MSAGFVKRLGGGHRAHKERNCFTKHILIFTIKMNFALLPQMVPIHAEIWLIFIPRSVGFLRHSHKHNCKTTANVRNLVKWVCILGAIG